MGIVQCTTVWVKYTPEIFPAMADVTARESVSQMLHCLPVSRLFSVAQETKHL